METRQQGSTLFSAMLVLIATLVVLQLSLLTAALDALLGRRADILLPTAVTSGVLFLVSAAFLWHVVSFDERLQQWGPRE